MAIFTKTQLISVSESATRYQSLTFILNEARQDSKILSDTSIFLSHSHLDKEWVEKVVVIFRKLGIRVYVDWMDNSMPPTTSGETAAKIKEKIKSNKKFILLATDRAIASKWCNWELGYGDAFKYIDHIAMFPLSEASGSWTGNEYLRIYPRIELDNEYQKNYSVKYPDGSSISITSWLKR